MQSMDTNTEYQKVVRVGDQMGKIVKITIRIIFLWNLNPLFFKKEIFKSHLKKSPHLKCQFPPKIPICPYINRLKNGSSLPPPPSPQNVQLCIRTDKLKDALSHIPIKLHRALFFTGTYGTYVEFSVKHAHPTMAIMNSYGQTTGKWIFEVKKIISTFLLIPLPPRQKSSLSSR